MELFWYSVDRDSAFTNATFDRKPPVASCESPVAKHFHLGQSIGVRGTQPTVYLEDGSHIVGYLPPEEIVKALSAQ